jgi:DMSO reductase family type II enzyme heme b subunit
VVSLQVWPYADGPRLDVGYWSADTQEAVERLATDLTSARMPAAPSTRVLAKGEPMVLKSHARYDDGRWQVVLQRELEPRHPDGAARLAVGRLSSIAVAIWDGGNPEVRAVSAWVDVALQPVSGQQ